MDLTTELVPLTVTPVSHSEAKGMVLALRVQGIDSAVSPPLSDATDFLADGGWPRSIGSHTVYVLPKDLDRSLAAIQERHAVPGYLLERDQDAAPTHPPREDG